MACRHFLNSEYSLSPKKSRNYDLKYKKNIIENPSKIINKTPSRKFKRSYSSCFNDRKEDINAVENIKTPNKNKIPKINKRELSKNNSPKEKEKEKPKEKEKEEQIKKKLSPGKFNIND